MSDMRLIKRSGSKLSVSDRAYVQFNSGGRGSVMCDRNKADCDGCDLFDGCVGSLKRLYPVLRHRGLNRYHFINMMMSVRFGYALGSFLVGFRVVYEVGSGGWVIKADMVSLEKIK